MNLKILDEKEVPDAPHPSVIAAAHAQRAAEAQKQQQAAINMISIALKALSEKALIAVSNLFTLAAVGSVFFLFYKVLPAPSYETLAGLTLYGLFVLFVEKIRRS